MKVPHSVCEVLREHVVLESECIDRMYLNVYVPQLQRIGGVVWYLRGHLGQRFASTAGVAPKTDAFVANIGRFVAEQGVEMVSFAKHQRKDEITQQARRIGTFEVSTLPDQDCCQLFVPRSPATAATVAELVAAETALDVAGLVSAAVAQTESETFTFPAAKTG